MIHVRVDCSNLITGSMKSYFCATASPKVKTAVLKNKSNVNFVDYFKCLCGMFFVTEDCCLVVALLYHVVDILSITCGSSTEAAQRSLPWRGRHQQTRTPSSRHSPHPPCLFLAFSSNTGHCRVMP